jgi:hypothetical protein
LGTVIVRGDNVVLISPSPRWSKWKEHHQWEEDQEEKHILHVEDVAVIVIM